MSHIVQSVTAQPCILILFNVGRLQRGQPLTRSCLPSSLPKAHELPVKKRNLETLQESAPALVLPDKSRRRIHICPKTTRGKRSCSNSGPRCSGESGLSAHPLRRVVLSRGEPSHRNHGSALHSHAQRVSGLFKNDEGGTEAVGKVGRDGGGNTGTTKRSRLRTRKWLDGSKQVRWVDSKLLRSSRPVRTPWGYLWFAPGMSRGPLPWAAAAAAVLKVAIRGKRRGVCDDACCPIRNVLEVQRVVQPDGWSGHSCSAKVRREQLDAPLSSPGRGEGLQNGEVRRKRSVGWSSFSCPPATSSARVDKTGSQSCAFSKSRCRAKLHGIFEHAQRQSRDGRFFLAYRRI